MAETILFKTLEINMMDAVKGLAINLKIKRKREFQIRFWLSIRLLKIAALIGGFGFEVVEEESNA